MRGKRLRIASVAILLGLIAAIPASTQGLLGSEDDVSEAARLPLLVLVNRMELTPEQMEEIHGILAGLLEERDALGLRRAELEQEMIAFNGTAEELDELLEAFRAETEAQVQAAYEHAEDAIDRIKEILTLKQGEILAGLLPGFLGDRGATFLPRGGAGRSLGRRGTGAASPLRGEILGQLQERLGGAASDGGFSGRMQAGRGTTSRGLGWIERLVEVLELKLEAIE